MFDLMKNRVSLENTTGIFAGDSQEPDDARDAEYTPDKPLIACTFGRRKEIRDDDKRHREQTRAAESLETTEDDELIHTVADEWNVPELPGGTGEERSGEEHADSNDFDRPPTKGICQFSVDRNENGGGEQMCRLPPRRTRPGHAVGDNPGKRCGDDRLVEGAEKHGEQYSNQCEDSGIFVIRFILYSSGESVREVLVVLAQENIVTRPSAGNPPAATGAA